MARKRRQRERAVYELPVCYCRDNPEVQRFVDERVWDFSPYCVPETMRDVFEAARAEFGDWNCFYLEIQPH